MYDAELAKNASIFAALTDDKEQRSVLIREVETLNDKAINNSTSNILLLFGTREAYFNLNRYLPGNQKYLNKAIQIQKYIVEMSPTSALEFNYLARLQFRAQNLQSAEIATKKALSLKSDYTKTKILLARIYKEQGRAKEFNDISEELGEDFPESLR